MKSHLLTQIRTTDERSQTMNELTLFERQLFSPTRQSLSAKLKLLRPQTAKILRPYLSDTASDVELLRRSQTLREDLLKLPVVSLTLPLAPTSTLLATISSWLRDQGIEAVIDISVQPQIVAGMTIAYQGKYKDLSLNKKIDEYLEKK